MAKAKKDLSRTELVREMWDFMAPIVGEDTLRKMAGASLSMSMKPKYRELMQQAVATFGLDPVADVPEEVQ